jgi:hypothetical protein
MKIATIINYCSNERKFLYSALEQAKFFSDEVSVVACDHFYDGTLENIEQMRLDFSSFTNVNFFIYPFCKQFKTRYFPKKSGTNFYHSLSRFVGEHFLSKDIDYVLFLDIDEIVDGERFKAWMKAFSFSEYDALYLSAFWYFREAKYQATTWEDTSLLVKKKCLNKKNLLNVQERAFIFNSVKGKKIKSICGIDNLPMIHHYSWVRSQEEMLKKVSTWGHKNDRKWSSLVTEEFSHPFLGKDFVHGYQFKEVTPFIDLEYPDFKQDIKSSSLYFLKEDQLKNIVEDNIFFSFLGKKRLDLNLLNQR